MQGFVRPVNMAEAASGRQLDLIPGGDGKGALSDWNVTPSAFGGLRLSQGWSTCLLHVTA